MADRSSQKMAALASSPAHTPHDNGAEHRPAGAWLRCFDLIQHLAHLRSQVLTMGWQALGVIRGRCDSLQFGS